MAVLNKIYCTDWLNNDLPDKCAQLIIADPPYFEVKGEFDFIWKSFNDYLKDVEKWAIECKRILADNGTLYWYGDAKNIAYTQVIFDKYFNLLNSLVWENTNDHKQQIRFNTDLRTFAPLTERLLMYGNGNDSSGLNAMLQTSMIPIQEYMNKQRQKANVSYTFISKLFDISTTAVAHWFNYPTQPSLPEQSKYNKLREFIDLMPYEDLQKWNEELRIQHEELRRPFYNERFYGDVIRLPNYETNDYQHETIKPETLSRILILTSSRKNDLVVVPFAGSGTECAMSAKECRKFIGYDIKQEYVDMANKRCNLVLSQPQLF
jgi:DNA modification methylase